MAYWLIVNNMNRRLKGVGMGPVVVSFLVVQVTMRPRLVILEEYANNC